jgi:ppGpp synthetase/RelA/SpoT-type nucleotidyltranferase
MNIKYSGKDVIRAGEQLVASNFFENKKDLEAVLDILSYWRFSHEKPLAKALDILIAETLKVDRSAIFAKRLKRYISIRNKLLRFEKMKLKNMQDIGGCRAIVANKKKLIQTVRALKKRPEFKSTSGSVRYKDYIENPKEDGYRSYHLVGQFKDNLGDYKNIEVQIRTRLQHDWATVLEIIDLFTKQSLKSNQGTEDWQNFFKNVSEQFAVMESVHMFSSANINKIDEYYRLVSENPQYRLSCLNTNLLTRDLDVINKLDGFANTIKIIEDRLSESDGYVLLEINIPKTEVKTTIFKRTQNEEAEAVYTEAEKKSVGKDIVVALVYASSVGEIKEAYPNYFADSTDFIKHLMLINGTHL